MKLTNPLPTIKITEMVGENKGSCTILVDGISIPHKYYKPVSKIWSVLRKRIYEKFGIDVVGAFSHDPRSKRLICMLLLNYGITDYRNLKKEEIEDSFERHQSELMLMFEDALQSFIDDTEGGYTQFVDLEENGIKDDLIYDCLMNQFLEKINLRTEEDKRRKAIKKKRDERKAQKREIKKLLK